MKFKVLLTLGISMMATATAVAALHVETRPVSFQSSMTEISHKITSRPGFPDVESRVLQMKAAEPRAGAETVTVSVDPVCDAEAGQEITSIKAYGHADGAFYSCSVWDGKVEDNFELEPGVYDFIFMWTGEDGMRVVVKQNVEVAAEMTVTADAKEAAEHFVYNLLMPDGSTAPGAHLGGDVESAELSSAVLYKDEVLLLLFTNVVDYSSGVSSRRSADVWSNGMPGLGFFEFMVTAHSDGNYIILAGADPSKPGTYSNNPANYYTKSCTIADNNKYISEPDPEDEVDQSKTGTAIGAAWKDGFLNTMKSDFTCGTTWAWDKYSICEDPVNAPAITLSPFFARLSFMTDNHDAAFIAAPLYDKDGNVWAPTYATETLGTNFMLSALANNENGAIPFGGNPAFAVSYDDPVVFGDNAPTITFVRPTNVMQYSFIGRYGEMRNVDLYNHKLSVKCDGKEVCSSYSELQSFGWSDEAAADGPWDISIIDENFMVDGLQGKTSCEQHFVAGPREDTPTVTIMQFRDAEGHPTFRFDRAEDGRVAFAAGAFKYNVDYKPFWHQWYDCLPLASVKLEYSAYGANQWNEITVEEDPSKFDHSYGAYYSGSLAGVEKAGETGWFDVRITVADEKGNTQQQVVSPAFLVKAYDSIEMSSADTEVNACAEYYTLQGVKVSNPLPGSILIVRRGNRVAKEIVR